MSADAGRALRLAVLLLAVAGLACSTESAGERSAEAGEAGQTGGRPDRDARAVPGDAEADGGLREVPHHIEVLEAEECESEGTPLSLKGARLPLDEVVAILSEVSDTPIVCECDLTQVTADLHFEGVPWDCVLGRIAREMGLEVELEGTGIRLVGPRRRTLSGKETGDR